MYPVNLWKALGWKSDTKYTAKVTRPRLHTPGIEIRQVYFYEDFRGRKLTWYISHWYLSFWDRIRMAVTGNFWCYVAVDQTKYMRAARPLYSFQGPKFHELDPFIHVEEELTKAVPK